jgi:uncharacterized protein YqgC (DUF456 family)
MKTKKKKKTTDTLHFVLGFIILILGVVLMPIPIIPGIIFVLIGASLMGYKLSSLFRNKKKKK